MRLLSITHWSFGRDRELLREIREVVDHESIYLHDLRTDPDLNRTLLVFTSDHEFVRTTLVRIAGLVFPRVDLSKHVGAHSRTGALDICSMVLPVPDPTRQEMELAMGTTELFAAILAAKYEIPILLTDKAGRSTEADSLEIKEGGFGSLIGQTIEADFGPCTVHPRLGMSLIGIRDYFITFQIDFESPNGGFARTLAREATELRTAGDPHFLGVEASHFTLTSRERVRLSIEIDLPDLATPDPIIEWALDRAAREGIRAFAAELVGAIRVNDLPGATRLSVRDPQIFG